MTKIKLDFPINIDGAKVGEITLRRPTVKDMRVARNSAKDDASQEIALISNLAQITTEDVEALDLADYAKVQAALQGFFSSTATTA